MGKSQSKSSKTVASSKRYFFTYQKKLILGVLKLKKENSKSSYWEQVFFFLLFIWLRRRWQKFIDHSGNSSFSLSISLSKIDGAKNMTRRLIVYLLIHKQNRGQFQKANNPWWGYSSIRHFRCLLFFSFFIDTAGQEEWKPMRDQWIRNGDGFVLVYSVIARASLDEIKFVF